MSPRFAADIDATILTSDPEVNEMHIDFNGITVRREQVGNKTRIRATGKINGGGERVELYAEEGDIHISAQTLTPIRLANPKYLSPRPPVPTRSPRAAEHAEDPRLTTRFIPAAPALPGSAWSSAVSGASA